MSNTCELPPDPFSSTEIATPEQVEKLRIQITAHEPVIEPFSGIPEGIDPGNFTELIAPPTYDESMAPATTLRAPDGRILWLSVFRDPDTNRPLRHTLIVINNKDRAETDQDFTIEGSVLSIEGRPATMDEALELQNIIDVAERINPFK